MKKFVIAAIIAMCMYYSRSQSIDNLYNASKTNSDFSSYFSVNDEIILTDNQMQKWVAKNKYLFSDVATVKIITSSRWVYGSKKNIVTRVDFVKKENEGKRSFYYAEIHRKKEEARLAELIRNEEIRKQKEEQDKIESLRLTKIKSEIENGTFTGEHFYNFPEGKYVGRFVNGIREGMGKQYLSNGEWYEGQFHNGKANGKGTFRQSGGIRYTGNFVNWKRQGAFFAEKSALLGLVSDTWNLEFDNDVLVSKDKTSSEMSDLFSGSTSHNSSNNSSDIPPNETSKQSVQNNAPSKGKHIEFREDRVSKCSQGYIRIFKVYKNDQYYSTINIGILGDGKWYRDCPKDQLLPQTTVLQSKMTLKEFLIDCYSGDDEKADSYSLKTLSP